jgi:hypothetical protein
MVMEEKGEEEQADRKFKFEDMCEDAPESKIQSVPSVLFRVKLFMAAIKAAWSQLGVEVDDDGLGTVDDAVYGRAETWPYM